jgi:hypothetical protein
MVAFMDPLYVTSLLYDNLSDSSNSNDLYSDVNWSHAHSMTFPSVAPKNNTTAMPSAATMTTPTPSGTATLPGMENIEIQGSEPVLTDTNATGITGATHSIASTSNSLPAPPASTENTEVTDQSQAPLKRTKGLAVVGVGLTDK